LTLQFVVLAAKIDEASTRDSYCRPGVSRLPEFPGFDIGQRRKPRLGIFNERIQIFPLRSRWAKLPQGIEPCQVGIIASPFPVLDRSFGGIQQPSQALLAYLDALSNSANDFRWRHVVHFEAPHF
jgi:hypothetical protein